jgi:hypothetical protein
VDPNQALIIYPFEIQNGNGARVWYNGTSVIDQDNGVIADGKFHHFVFVSRSANDQELFVDGINIATTLAANKTLPATLTGVTIGAWNPTGQYYTGALDDVRIYNRALQRRRSNNSTLSAQPISGIQIPCRSRAVSSATGHSMVVRSAGRPVSGLDSVARSAAHFTARRCWFPIRRGFNHKECCAVR